MVRKGATPAPSGHTSRPSFDFRRTLICDEMTSNLQQYIYPQYIRTVISRRKNPLVYMFCPCYVDMQLLMHRFCATIQALIRDDFRCMLTKKIDTHSWDRGDGPSCKTQCCHIFSKSKNRNLQDEPKVSIIRSLPLGLFIHRIHSSSTMPPLLGLSSRVLDTGKLSTSLQAPRSMHWIIS